MIFIPVILFVIWLGAIFVFAYQDRRYFNHGVCRYCGEKVEHVDTDSQGGKLWACPRCGFKFWTNWVFNHEL